MSQSLEARFGALRDIAHTLTGDARWQQLTYELNDWPEHYLQEIIIPYLSDLLRDDESDRAAPDTWINFGHSDVFTHPAWSLARAVAIGGMLDEDLFILSQTPRMKLITNLSLGLYFSDEGVVALTASPHIQQLKSLSLHSREVGPTSATAIAQAATLSGLTKLVLSHCWIETAGVLSLTQSPHLHQLHTLELESCDIGSTGVVAIARAKTLSKLATLNLARNGVKALEASQLVQSPHMKNLEHLDLSVNHIEDHGAEAIARSPYMSKLTMLGLAQNNIGAAGARALAQSPHLSNLTSLDLGHNPIADEGAQALAQSPYLNDKIKRYWQRYIDQNPVKI